MRIVSPSATPFTLLLVLVLGGCAPSTAEPSPKARELLAVREATARYRDVRVALADGYLSEPSGMCVTAAMVGARSDLGAMGVHYFRPDLLGITATAPRVNGTDAVVEFARPEVLVYEPQADGSMTLVAAEYMVFEQAWRAAGNSAAPNFHGEPFVLMRDDPATPMDEAHQFEPHYELHVWVHRDNPNGMFHEFNPRVRCPEAAPHGGH